MALRGYNGVAVTQSSVPFGRHMSLDDRIVTDPGILTGKPIIKGTRLAVEFIIELLANRWTEDQILANYPGITREDVAACLAYAAERLKSERVYPVPTG